MVVEVIPKIFENRNILIANLPATIGNLSYQGTWDGSTNTPTLADGVGTAGQYYSVSVAGTQNLGSGNIVFTSGDELIYNGTVWQKIDSGEAESVTDSVIPLKSGGFLQDSALTEGSTEITSTKSIVVPPASLILGQDGSSISSSAHEIHSQTTDNVQGYLVRSEFDDTGSLSFTKPLLSAKVLDETIQALKDTNSAAAPFSFTYTTQGDRHTTALTFESPDTGTLGYVVREGSDSGPIISEGSQAVTANTETKVTLERPICYEVGVVLHVSITGIRLKGTGSGQSFQPFFKIDYFPTSNDPIMTETSVYVKEPVEDKDLSTPPGSPSAGDRYIVGASGTGDWVSQDNAIAEYSGTAWTFYTPREGDAVYIKDEDLTYINNGTSWVAQIDNSEQVEDIIGSKVVAGSGISVSYNDTTGETTISSASGAFDAPRITNFAIDIAARVDLNTDLNVSKTVTYDVMHFDNIQSLTLDVVTGDNKTLTVPTSNASQSEVVTLSGITTSSETTLTFKITGVDTQGSSFESNSQTVSVRNVAANEFIYYALSSTNNPASIDTGTMNTTEVESTTRSYTIATGTATAGQYFIVLTPDAETVTSIQDTVLNQDVTTLFTQTEDVRQINTQNYDSYVIGPLTEGLSESYIITFS